MLADAEADLENGGLCCGTMEDTWAFRRGGDVSITGESIS